MSSTDLALPWLALAMELIILKKGREVKARAGTARFPVSTENRQGWADEQVVPEE